jgi:hypothetical protein
MERFFNFVRSPKFEMLLGGVWLVACVANLASYLGSHNNSYLFVAMLELIIATKCFEISQLYAKVKSIKGE